MSKKAQGIIWTVIAVIALILIGFVIYNFIMYKNQDVQNPEVTFEVAGYGNIKLVLYPEYAPNTVKNFITLVNSNYYKDKVVYGKDEYGIYFGRNSEGNVDPVKLSLINSDIEADSEDDYEYEINGEFVANKYKENTLNHKKYVVSMVRADYTKQVAGLTDQSYNSASSQFMILNKDVSELNGLYAAFGEVVEGMEIIDKLSELELKAESEDEPGMEYNATTINPFASYPVITNITVDTKGVDYGMPEVHEAFDYSSYLYKLMTQYYGNE